MKSKFVEGKPGTAVIAAEDCFPNIEDLQRDFNLLDFLDFCAGIDAAILYENLVCGGASDSNANPVYSALLSEGVIKDIAETGAFRIRQMNLSGIQEQSF